MTIDTTKLANVLQRNGIKPKSRRLMMSGLFHHYLIMRSALDVPDRAPGLEYLAMKSDMEDMQEMRMLDALMVINMSGYDVLKRVHLPPLPPATEENKYTYDSGYLRHVFAQRRAAVAWFIQNQQGDLYWNNQTTAYDDIADAMASAHDPANQQKARAIMADIRSFLENEKAQGRDLPPPTSPSAFPIADGIGFYLPTEYTDVSGGNYEDLMLGVWNDAAKRGQFGKYFNLAQLFLDEKWKWGGCDFQINLSVDGLQWYSANPLQPEEVLRVRLTFDRTSENVQISMPLDSTKPPECSEVKQFLDSAEFWRAAGVLMSHRLWKFGLDSISFANDVSDALMQNIYAGLHLAKQYPTLTGRKITLHYPKGMLR